MSVIVLCAVFLFIDTTTAKIEGSPCRRKSFNGTCVLAKHCETLILDHRSDDYPPVCGFDDNKNPIVCCTSCNLVEDINLIYLDTIHGRLVKKNDKSWNACIDIVKDISISRNFACRTIFNFFIRWDSDKKCHSLDNTVRTVPPIYDVKRPMYPFTGLLGFGPSIEEVQWLCAGSVISSWFVLTAAHCISEPTLGDVKYVSLGIETRSDPPKQYYTFSDIIPHPDYASPSKYHDIALLKTAEQIEFNSVVVPVCLYAGQAYASVAVATGWGYLGPNMTLPEKLRRVNLTKFSDEDCAELYPPHRTMSEGYDRNTQLCYGDTVTSANTCQGDSGGPLVLHESEVGCTLVLLGVTSSGVPCGEPGAGLYTRVEYYKPWIESIVWP